MKQLVNRAMRALTRPAVSRRIAGEAVVLRDGAGTCFAVPLEVFVAGASSAEAATAIDRRVLQFLGIASDHLAFGDSQGRRYAVPLEALAGARVPECGGSMLEDQLEGCAAPTRHADSRFGWLELAGSLCVTYAVDPQDSQVPTPTATPAERADAVELPGLQAARENFVREGWFALSGGAFGTRLSRLREEGSQRLRPASHEYEIESEDRLAIRIKRLAASGPVLESILHDPVVISTLRAATGTVVVPTQSAYYYYSGNDYITVHTDASHCPLAIVVKVYGEPAPLIAYPDLLGCSPEKLAAFAQGTLPGTPPRAQPMHFPDQGAIVFKGCELPHHRPPAAAGSGFIGVAQLCYRSVWRATRGPRRMVATRALAPDGAGVGK